MTQEAFYFWISNVFVPSLPPKDERQFIMLLVDGHSSHKDFRTSKLCRLENIVLFSLPPHTSHVLQPLDRGFFGPFKSYFRSECAAFTQKMQSAVNRFSFGRVFSDAFRKTAQNDIIKKAFECSGIWPPNKDQKISPNWLHSKHLKGKNYRRTKMTRILQTVSRTSPTMFNILKRLPTSV